MFSGIVWQDQARCRNLPSNEADGMFYVGRGKKTTEAKKFCNNCPVQRECLQYAIVNHEEGIWAGTSDKERKEMAAFVSSLEYSFLKRQYDVETFIEEALRPLDPVATVVQAGEVTASIFEISGPSDEELIAIDIGEAS